VRIAFVQFSAIQVTPKMGLHVGNNNCTIKRPVVRTISATADSTTLNLSDIN
jgi:hypothetical protein